MAPRSVIRLGAAAAVVAAILAVAPGANASNDVHVSLAQTTWQHDLKVVHEDWTNSVSHRDSKLQPSGPASASATMFPEHEFGRFSLTAWGHKYSDPGTITLSGNKYDFDGTAHAVNCKVTVEDPAVGSMSIENESGCDASGVSVELSSGFLWGLGGNDYKLILTLTGEPQGIEAFFKPAEIRASAIEAVGARKDCIIGTDGDDDLKGTPGDDCIIAGKGDDDIDGKGGNDVIIAGPGDDNIVGGDGDDKIFAGSGDDYIDPGKGKDYVHGATGSDTVASGDSDGDPDTVVDSQSDVSPQVDSTDSGATREVGSEASG